MRSSFMVLALLTVAYAHATPTTKAPDPVVTDKTPDAPPGYATSKPMADTAVSAVTPQPAEEEHWLTSRIVPRFKHAKVPFKGPPGEFVSHLASTPYGEGHRFVDRRGQHYFCPFHPGCDYYADTERLDEACLDYSRCLQFFVNNKGYIAW